MSRLPPASIRIHGVDVPLRDRPLRELATEFGQYHYDTKTIDYRRALRGEALRDTVLHEVMHAVLDQPRDHGLITEEDYVLTLSTGLTKVLQNNPTFAVWLTTF
jgi:hypothetical protein